MIKRLYIDNFRCMVNFELELDRLQLFLGGNGTGKTSVFDVLHRLQQFITGRTDVSDGFPFRDLTRWDTRDSQRFELDIETEQTEYKYVLQIQHDRSRELCRVSHEYLTVDGMPLFNFEKGEAKLHREVSGGIEPVAAFPFDPSRSGLSVMPERTDNTKLIAFRKAVARWLILGLVPSKLSAISGKESESLDRDGGQFADWYRHLSQEYQGLVVGLFQQLQDVMLGFRSLSLQKESENYRKIIAHLEMAEDTYEFGFTELSTGQQLLIVLYTLLAAIREFGCNLYIDEPDNFVALREIQPWLHELQDICCEKKAQAVLISHHPEIINSMAKSEGIWFSRPECGPVRVSKGYPTVDGLTPAGTMARGWDDE